MVNQLTRGEKKKVWMAQRSHLVQRTDAATFIRILWDLMELWSERYKMGTHSRLGYENVHTRTPCTIFFYGTWRLGTTLWFPSKVGCAFAPSQLRREVLQRNIQTRRWHQKFRTMTHFIRVNQPAGVLTEIELGCQMRDQCKHMYACYTLSMRDM